MSVVAQERAAPAQQAQVELADIITRHGDTYAASHDDLVRLRLLEKLAILDVGKVSQYGTVDVDIDSPRAAIPHSEHADAGVFTAEADHGGDIGSRIVLFRSNDG